MKKHLINILLFFLYFSLSFGANSELLKFESIDMESGLNHNSANCFLHSSTGLLWIGTFEGVSVYDGYSITNYTQTSSALTNNFIECLFEDNDNNIWVGTQNGLFKYDNEAGDFTSQFMPNYTTSDTANAISHNVIKCIYQDTDGDLLIGTYGGGLSIYNIAQDRFTTYTTSNSTIQSDFINTIHQDINGVIWLGSWVNGLIKFNKKEETFKRFLISDEEEANTINCISEIRNNRLWLGTWGTGIVVFNSETLEFEDLPKSIKNNKTLSKSVVRSILGINNYEIYVGTFGDGLFQLHTTNSLDYSVEQYTYDPFNNYSIKGNSIWSLYKDRSGLCWIATWGDGISKIDFSKNKFSTFSSISHFGNGLDHHHISAICEIEPSIFLIGTFDGGLYELDLTNSKVTNIDKNGLISESKGISVFSNKVQNRLVIGTKDKAYIYDITKKNLTPILSDYYGVNLKRGEISSTYIDNNNNIWIAIRGRGLNKLEYLDNGKYKLSLYVHQENIQGALSSNNITSITSTHANEIWISTLGGGINIYNERNNNFENIILNDSTKNINTHDVLTVYEGRNGKIWIGSLSNGLWEYDRKTNFARSYDKNDGLSNNAVYSINEDQNNNLWLSTGYGISKFNNYSKKFHNYSKIDGLHGNTFNIDIYSAVYKTEDNKLVFGGKNGITYFYPSRIVEDLYVPEVIINKLTIDGKLVEKGDYINKKKLLTNHLYKTEEIVLTRKEKVITLEFASLHYATPVNNKYRYTLEGFDNGWIETSSTRRYATYTNLPPGSYKFKVQASNSHGIWHTLSSNELIITVKPPFWLTIWFFVLVAIFVTIIIWALYKNRMKYINLQLSIQEKLHETEQILKEKQLYKLEQEKLSLELDEKNKKLASSTVFINEKNQRLKNVKDFISEIEQHIDDKGKHTLRKINSIIEENINKEEDWETFEKSFDILHNDFIQRFTKEFPKITHKDIKMVGYIRMNYSNKEIADLLNISIRSVESFRYRLRKKMELESNINLNDFIIRF